MSRTEEQQVSVAFVDNTDFFSVGEEVMENMVQILKTYIELFQATGRRRKYEKTACFSWKWEWKKGKKGIIHKLVQIEIERTILKMEYYKGSIRTLGIHMNQERNWSK